MLDPRLDFDRQPVPFNAHSRNALQRVRAQAAEKLVVAALCRHPVEH